MAGRTSVTCKSHRANEWWSYRMNLSNLTPKPSHSCSFMSSPSKVSGNQRQYQKPQPYLRKEKKHLKDKDLKDRSMDQFKPILTYIISL